MRLICGMIKPTQPILPLIATWQATNVPLRAITNQRNRPTFTPNAFASLSSKESKFKRQLSFSNNVEQHTKGTKKNSHFSVLAVAKLPINQNTILGNFSSVSETYCNRLTNAENSPLKIIPIKISISKLLRPNFTLNKKTSTSVLKPKKIVLANKPYRLKLKKMASVPPNAEPEVTPIICGSTNGLRKIPCNAAPLKANPAPTQRADKIRGKRTWKITC